MSNNDKKVYAIRNLGSWYTDEYYHFPLFPHEVEAGHICALFEDKETALQAWKHLEYKAGHEINFSHIIGHQEANYNLEELGFESTDTFWNKLKQMNKDELFAISQKINCHVFFMYEYPADLKLKTLFNLQDKDYDSYDGTTDSDYISNVFLYVNDYIGTRTMNGSLDELSDAPLLLSQLIKNNPNIKYNEDSKTLEINPDEQTLNSVNALLKKPLFEIRYLTIKEIYEIEQTLNSPNNQVA